MILLYVISHSSLEYVSNVSEIVIIPDAGGKDVCSGLKQVISQGDSISFISFESFRFNFRREFSENTFL
jgi:hypothetical protein